MKTYFASMFALTGLFAVMGFNVAQPTKVTLTGARPEIHAINYASLQEAIDAVPEDGGIVRIPPGIFELSEPLVISGEDITLEGSGAATHLINMNTEGKPAILLSHPDVKNPLTDKHNLWRIRLAHFRVTGNEKSGHGIEARRINEIHIDSVTISENGGDGILLDHCYEDPRISDCLITYNKQVGLNLLGCHDIIVSANQFEENNDALHCIDGYNLAMSGNNLDDHLRHGVVIENTYGSFVSANMIEECQGSAVIMDRDCYGNTVSANVIAHNGGGVDLRDAHGCAISANTFTLMKSDAVRIGPASGRITVSANHFSNSYLGDGKVKRAANDLLASGLILEGTHHIGISGNGFSGLHTPAIEVRGEPSTQILIDGNVLTDVESQHENLPEPVLGEMIHTPVSSDE
ncbi:MAG: right-handed parallel beta-helix repeat-containing protein [Planctomycetaceae bacterium]|nr:right-handed parallel beta-helix repeat-containing protein [Planctomycetaceae bacterium]